MSGNTRAFLIKDQTQKGKPEVSRLCVNFGKVLPATATGNLFSVTGTVVITGLFGIVSTVFGITAVKPTLGVTGLPTALAAAPAVAYASTAVGSVVTMPPSLGAALPAAVVANASSVTAVENFIVTAANITITTDATNAGAITWVLAYEPVYPKGQVATVAAV
jgi:hypothetical protein